MSSHHTRAARQDDTFVMEQIMRDAFEASYVHFMPEQYIREWYDNNTAQKTVRMGLDRAGIVEIMGRVVGFVIYYDNSITELWVEPKYWEQGAGTALVEWVEAEYRKKGYPTITMYCYESNINTLDFLKKNRFRRASQHFSNDVSGGPVVVYNMLKMVRKLKG